MRSRECDEEEIQAKQEGDHNENHNHQVTLNNMLQQQNQPVLSSRQWTSAFRNPRIVRVSRTFGGKDRHSKVCTVRGLRDRRIRLSVPTAIQLYDLQDRLGLSQPSKVIDWLLEAAKDDVDELPPLQFPHGFNQMYPNLIFGNSGIGESSSTSAFPGTNLGFLESWDLGGSSSRTRSRIADTTTTQRESFDLDKGKWIKHDENSNHQDHGGFDMNHQHFSLTNPYNNNNNNNNNNNTSSYYNLGHHSLDQSGNNVTVAISNVPNNNSNLNLPPPSSSAGDGSQLFFGPPPPAMSSLFPTYPSFLGASHQHHHHHLVDGAGNLQLFSSNANTASQQQLMTGNSSLIRPFHHLMSSNHGTDRHSSDNDSDS